MCISRKAFGTSLDLSSLRWDLGLIQTPSAQTARENSGTGSRLDLQLQLGLKFLSCLPLPAFTALRQSQLLGFQR